MSLKERLMDDLKQAMRDKDALRRETIRMVRSAVRYAEIEWQREATDEEIISLIQREVKRRQEALEMFRKGGRQDLVTTEEAALKILQEYLPRQLDEQEIRQVVERIVSELGASGPSQLGPVMRKAMAELRGRADGRLVNQIAREILSR